MNKIKGEILTEKKALAALRVKEELKNKKIEKKKNNENRKKVAKNNSSKKGDISEKATEPSNHRKSQRLKSCVKKLKITDVNSEVSTSAESD